MFQPDNNQGLPPAFFDLNLHDGNESGDSEEDRSSPPTSLDDFNIAIQLAPDNPDLMNLIQDLRRRGLTQQIPDDKCAKFNATPQGPKFTCRLFRNNGQRCSKSFARHDRFKHHLQGHIRITPFCCMDFGGFTAEPKCLELFSSIAARDTHARNKGESPTRKCGTKVLPKNFARHKKHCKTCSDIQPGVTPHLGASSIP